MAHDVYICYDEKDLSVAWEILHLFEENDIKCLFKERDMDSLDFDMLEYKIESSKLFLLILSKNANESPYIKNELQTAFSKEIPIITFKIDDCNLEDYFEFFISLDLSIDAYPNYKDELDYLLKFSSLLLGRFDEALPISKSIRPKAISNLSFSHDVFIEYSSWDSREADKIRYLLEQNGIKCWIAPRDLRQGNDIYSEVVRAIKNAKIFLLIFSKDSYQSIFSKNNLEIAINREKPIISFNIDETISEMEIYSKIHMIPAYPRPEGSYEALVYKILEIMPESSTLVPGEGRLPYPAYRGNDEYIFVSYAHRDANIVFPEVRRFQNLGYNVWYDEGIGAGNEWLKDIVAHLKNCKIFVVFISNNSMASVNVQKEIKYAVRHNKNIIPIYLQDYEDIEMEDDIDFELSVVPDISKTKMSEEEYVSKAVELFERYGF